MFFEEFIKQHRVHSLIADRAELALGVMGHQVRVHLCHLLGYEAELRDAQLVQLGLVMKSHRTQSKEHVTGSGHVGDVGLESARGEKDAQLAIIVHITGASTRPDCLTRNAADVAAVAHVRTCGADRNNVSGRGNAVAG